MLQEISSYIKESLSQLEGDDQLLFNNKVVEIKDDFQEIISQEGKSIAFVDGGQAEIIATGNFCLSFIRVFAQVFKNGQKLNSYKNEFYLFTRAVNKEDGLYYESKIFPLKNMLFTEEKLLISSTDSTIRTGTERAPISKVTNMARRFAELNLTKEIEADYIVLDGTLEPTFKGEENIVLSNNVTALAKSCSLFTTKGNNPVVLLKKKGIKGPWAYFVDGNTYFVKLHPKAKHVFRFEGSMEVLSYLLKYCSDAIFLGYPYGLILADRLARVSNQEKNSLKMKFLLNGKNKEIFDYLSASNAHEILDTMG